MVSPEDIHEDAASKGDGAGVGTVEEEEEAEEETSVRFRHIVGNISAKQALHENIVLPLTLPPVLRQQLLTGIRTGCGNVLLHGPPGTGKTMLVEAAANEAGAALLRIRPSSILSKFHGESERSLQRIFASLAAAKGPTLLFIDEFDSFACSRGNGEGGEGGQGRRLLAELLLQLTALKHARRSGGQMVVVAATNRIEDIDPAAIRRFETRVYVGTPSSAVERIRLVQGFLQPGNVLHALQMHDLKEIAQWTEGWSGSDIESMCREAAMAPVRRAFPLGEQVPLPQASAEDEETGWPSDDEEAYVEEHLLLAGAGAGAGARAGAGQMVTLGDFREAYLRATEFMDVHSDGDGGHI
jgi:SpoVK/Ycf46/Vps4 family AAA+-type ATPase